MRKAAPLKPIRPRASDSKLQMEQFGIEPEKHAELKEAMLSAARAAVEQFPSNLEAVKKELRQTFPESVLTAFFSYGMQASLGRSGEQHKALPDILQHHGELLHALVLTLPIEEWGNQPLTPDVMDRLFKAVPQLSNTFFMQRVLDGEAIQDEEAQVVLSLQERIRFHTHGVRNWGYFDNVVALSRDLYASLDLMLSTHHGFSASDVIDVLSALTAEFERRNEQHWDTLRRILRGRTVRKLVELYFRHVPGLKGSADEMLAELPNSVTREQMIGRLMSHLDLRLLDVATFTVAEVAVLTKKPEAIVQAALHALAFEPGALENQKPEHLFLDNPVWDHPAIRMGDRFVVPLPHMAFSHIHRLIDRLVAEAGLQKQLKDRRAVYLEQQLEAVFRSALPGAELKPGLKWKKNGQRFENDLVILFDHVVIIAEAKSHRITPSGLRGGKERVKRHLDEMVLEPSVQSSRLEAIILAARGGDAEAIAILAEVGIDPGMADRVVRLSVTLDDFSVLSASESDFKKVGWVPRDHALAPSLLISDLRCIADVLDNPLLLLHYLTERGHLQKSLNLFGDELDFLGLYLVTGFNLAALHDKFSEFSPTGMSVPIDRYYEGRAAGLNVPKPKMELRPLWRDIIDRLVQARPPGWTLVGMHLLSSADPAEQRAVERNLHKLRANVRKHYRDPKRISTLVIHPPEPRKGAVMFYVFPEQLQDSQRTAMQRLAAETVETEKLSACVIFSRSTEKWGQPYETVSLLERKAPLQAPPA